jgi:hypothetical protein
MAKAGEVRLHDAIKIAILSFVQLLVDDDGAIRLATLRLLHELADDCGLQSDSPANQLTRVWS